MSEPIARERARLLGVFRGPSATIPMPALGEALRAPSASLCVSGLNVPSLDGANVVPIAISRSGGAREPIAVCALGLGFARKITDAVLGRRASNTERPLSSAEEGALLYAVDRAAGDLLSAGLMPFRIAGVLADFEQIAVFLGAPARHEVSVDLCAFGLSGCASLLFAAPPDAKGVLRSSGSYAPAAKWPIRWACTVGATRLSLREVETLEVGDVVVLDSLCHPAVPDARGVFHLVNGSRRMAVRWLDDARLELVSTPRKETEMGDGDTVQLDVLLSPSEEVGALSVLAQVEVGRVTLTVEQALRLIPGTILSLDRPVGSEVWLRVGDKTIARGELVSCDGRLAVEVTEAL